MKKVVLSTLIVSVSSFVSFSILLLPNLFSIANADTNTASMDNVENIVEKKLNTSRSHSIEHIVKNNVPQIHPSCRDFFLEAQHIADRASIENDNDGEKIEDFKQTIKINKIKITNMHLNSQAKYCESGIASLRAISNAQLTKSDNNSNNINQEVN